MALSPGSRFDRYEVIELIGRGGMGEVYRARDTRLPREAAIKFSSRTFSERFTREAHVIASLNHPNITTLYDVGPDYLVMELVEGATLAERIKQAPLSLDEASAVARQIAEALDYAHERGIVHRDLKPGNVKIRPDGLVKVLDFGLAKAAGTQPSSQVDESPTMTTPRTGAGMILGTAAYMSPEQAKGQQVDKRTDIWAFGCVFYEMLTGRAAYHGDTSQETMASVLRDDPDLTKVTPQARRLLKRCLDKDPQKRPRHIGDVMLLLDEPASGEHFATANAVARPRAGRKWMWATVGAAVVLLGGAAFMWAPWRSSASVQSVRFEIPPVKEMTFVPGGSPAVSPDGRWVVLPGTGSDGVTRMWLRALDSVEVRPLVGTEAGNNLPPPVYWSPDSRFIAFSSNAGPFAPGQLKKLDIAGGPAQTICDVPGGVIGATWNRDGVIVFATNVGDRVLRRVSSSGGMSTPITVLDTSRREDAHWWPQFLPDGRHFLYFRRSADPDHTGVFIGALDVAPGSQSLKPLLLTNRRAAFAVTAGSPIGHLLSLRETTLFAQPFDPARLELAGEAMPIADQVGSFAGANAGLFSVSDTGVLVYRVGAGGTLAQLTWLDRTGKNVGTLGGRGGYNAPELSPDGTRVAVSQFETQTGDSNIWVLDIGRGTSTKVTFNKGQTGFPVWSPDGNYLAFSSNQTGRRNLYRKSADGSGDEQLLLKTDTDKAPSSWSSDGRFLLYTLQDQRTGNDIWVLPIGGGQPYAFLATERAEGGAHFSPDGRWIAYASDESGNAEVYVRPFDPDKRTPSSGGKWLVSKGSGLAPRWRADGKELLYVTTSLQQMSVDVSTEKTFVAGVPKTLFTSLPMVDIPGGTADGQRFLAVTSEFGEAGTPFTVVLNWETALKKQN
jgi:Tol biopolymer transport system component